MKNEPTSLSMAVKRRSLPCMGKNMRITHLITIRITIFVILKIEMQQVSYSKGVKTSDLRITDHNSGIVNL